MNSLGAKLIAGILFIIVPLVTVLIINSYYSVQVVRNQVAQSNKNLLGLYMGQMDTNLEEVDNYLFELSERNTDLLEMDNSSMNNDNEYIKAKLRLFNTISNDISYYKTIDLFFIYSMDKKELIMNQHFG
jgi:two-component system sensor histidine kinase YesM